MEGKGTFHLRIWSGALASCKSQIPKQLTTLCLQPITHPNCKPTAI